MLQESRGIITDGTTTLAPLGQSEINNVVEPLIGKEMAKYKIDPKKDGCIEALTREMVNQSDKPYSSTGEAMRDGKMTMVR